MMRLQAYAAFSFLATVAAIFYAFHSRGQFYPSLVYLSTSKTCCLFLLNMGLVIMCISWRLVKRLFLGTLREAEVERLNEQSWREVMEILIAVTIFRHDFSVTFLGMVTALLLIKALHWLAQKRVEYIETTPSVPMLSHIRIVSFMGFLLALDCLFMYSSLKPLFQTRQASVALFFAFEYTILVTTTTSISVKYVFYVTDMLMEGQWESKAVYTFYLELVHDLLHLSLYIVFFLVIIMNYGVPFHLIRELYETFRNFRIRVADYIRYRKITSNMNERLPDATTEELIASDTTCIICREEMVTAKKLPCGHLFHVHCLRSWLERQHTCPTCRAPVVPSDNASAGLIRHHTIPGDSRQQGTASAGISTHGSEGSVADNNLSQHNARIQTATLAASVYEKSFVFPPRNTFSRSPGYALVPRMNPQEIGVSNGEAAASASLQQQQNPLLLPCVYPLPPVSFKAPGPNASYLEKNTSQPSSEKSLKEQENLIQNQIELLGAQLRDIQKQKADQSEKTRGVSDTATADCEGKAVASD